MKRSLFFKVLLSLPFGIELLTGWRDRYDGPTFLLNRFFVAGFQHYEGPEIITSIQPGEKLLLIVEPDNSFDRFAVAMGNAQSRDMDVREL